MKVIDLLNKIANGEATNESDFVLKGDNQLTTIDIFSKEYYLNTETLNIEIEEKISKIGQCNFDISKVFKDLDTVQVSQFTVGIVDKLNEIIDEVNKLRRNKMINDSKDIAEILKVLDKITFKQLNEAIKNANIEFVGDNNVK